MSVNVHINKFLWVVLICFNVTNCKPASDALEQPQVGSGTSRSEAQVLKEKPTPVSSSPVLVDVLDSQAANGFSGCVQVQNQTSTLLRACRGRADENSQAALTPEHKFAIASLTKVFTAAAMMMLRDEGHLRLEDSVGKYIPRLAANSPVNVRHLLSHTSGIPSYTEDDDTATASQQPNSTDEMITRMTTRTLDFEPGSEFNYSNSNYYLLGYVVGRLSGSTWEQFIQNRLLTPARMQASGPLYSAASGRSDFALGHRVSSVGRARQRVGLPDPSYPHAAGAMFSTVGDLSLWARAFWLDKLIVRPATIQEMSTPVKGDYGLGIQSYQIAGRSAVGHNGLIDGYSTLLLAFPAEALTVVILSNNEDPEMVQRVAEGLVAHNFSK